jgi:hypothetical protein
MEWSDYDVGDDHLTYAHGHLNNNAPEDESQYTCLCSEP